MIKTQSATKKSAFTIKQVGDQFKVFDSQHRYRLSFPTKEQAEAYCNGSKQATPAARPFPATEATL